MSTIKFAKLRQDAIIPSKSYEDGGFDIYANFDEEYMVISPHETRIIPTGLISTFHPGYVVILKERGSTGTKGIAQRSGVIDSGYRGEWLVPLTNTTDKPMVILKSTNQSEMEALVQDYTLYPYEKAISQGLFVKLPDVTIKEVAREEVISCTSARGEGRLGSSGK